MRSELIDPDPCRVGTLSFRSPAHHGAPRGSERKSHVIEIVNMSRFIEHQNATVHAPPFLLAGLTKHKHAPFKTMHSSQIPTPCQHLLSVLPSTSSTSILFIAFTSSYKVTVKLVDVIVWTDSFFPTQLKREKTGMHNNYLQFSSFFYAGL